MREHYRERLIAAREAAAELLQMGAHGLTLSAELLERGDEARADEIRALDARLDAAYHHLHHDLIRLLALEAPVAGDLRIAMALLQIARHAERIGDQCCNVATAYPIGAPPGPRGAEIRRSLGEMAHRTLGEVELAARAVHAWDVSVAAELVAADSDVDRLNRDTFRRALELADTAEQRRWSMAMVLIARALERAGDNAVAVGAQLKFAATGELESV